MVVSFLACAYFSNSSKMEYESETQAGAELRAEFWLDLVQDWGYRSADGKGELTSIAVKKDGNLLVTYYPKG